MFGPGLSWSLLLTTPGHLRSASNKMLPEAFQSQGYQGQDVGNNIYVLPPTVLAMCTQSCYLAIVFELHCTHHTSRRAKWRLGLALKLHPYLAYFFLFNLSHSLIRFLWYHLPYKSLIFLSTSASVQPETKASLYIAGERANTSP